MDQDALTRNSASSLNANSCVPLAGWPALLRLHPHLHIFSSQPAAVRSVALVASNLWPKRGGALRRMLCHVWVLVVQKGLWTWEKLLNREASGRFSRAMSNASWNLSQSTAAQRHSEHATTCKLIERVSLGFPAEPGSLATWAQKSGNILARWRA